jgi:hypothetical protein
MKLRRPTLRRAKRNRVAVRIERTLLNVMTALWLTRRLARGLRLSR